MTTYVPEQAVPQMGRLRDAVAGRDRSLPKHQAIELVAASGHPESVAILVAVLTDSSQDMPSKALAAAHLGRIGNPAANRVLLANLFTAERDVADQILQTIGRIGDASAIEILLQAASRRHPWLANRARFAAALIAHRYRLADPEDCLLDRPKAREIPEDCRLSLEVCRPGSAEIDQCLLDVARGLYGVEVAPEHAVNFEHEDDKWIFLPNRDFVSTKDRAESLERRGIFGFVAEQDTTDGNYFVALIILFSPSNKDHKGSLHLYEPDGEQLHVGEAQTKEDRTTFSIRTVSDVSVNPVEIDGELGPTGLRVKRAYTAEVTARVRMARADSSCARTEVRGYERMSLG